MNIGRRTAMAGLATSGLLAGRVARAAVPTDIVVTHYAAQLYGAPYTIALEKGWFKEAGLDVGGIISSKGGSTSVRNLMSAETLFGEVALPAALTAIKEGIPVRIISTGTDGDTGFMCTRPGMKIETPDDLRGKRLGYTRPQSVTESVLLSMLHAIGLTRDDVKMVATGDVAGSAVALESNQIDVASIDEPIYSNKTIREKKVYQKLTWLNAKIPKYNQTVGIATLDNIEKNPAALRALLAARARGTEWFYANRPAAAKLLAESYDMDPAVVTSAIDNTLSLSPGWWNAGKFDMTYMNNMAASLALVNVLTLPIDWKSVMDLRFIPDADRPSI
jgi:NitT/TauT family transport system substrate-binding protein